MSTPAQIPAKPHLDGRTFQPQLASLANTLALKVQREGPKLLPQPPFVTVDIFVLLRQAHHTYDLFFFLNADDRRKKDCDWRPAYHAASLPLVRCMIDCLYNITAILQNPGVKGFQFRQSGYKKSLESVDADAQRYGGDPKWDDYIARKRELLRNGMLRDGVTETEVRAAKTWPTLGRYLTVKKNVSPTSHQQFLKRLTHGFWQEYSGMAHATFEVFCPRRCFIRRRTSPTNFAQWSMRLWRL